MLIDPPISKNELTVQTIYGIPVKATGVSHNVVARFLDMFSADQNGCWMWNGQRRASDGYGVFYYESQIPAHRFSFFLFNGCWPEDHTHHTCGKKPCVNPAHLEALTSAAHKQEHAKVRTACLHGHAWIQANWIIHKNGKKQCRLCHEVTHAAFLAKATETGHVPRPRKTHCVHGHELTEANVIIARSGARNCRECARLRPKQQRPHKPRGLMPHGLKSHCVNGHEYTEANKYYKPGAGGLYVCLACRNERNKSYVRKPRN